MLQCRSFRRIAALAGVAALCAAAPARAQRFNGGRGGYRAGMMGPGMMGGAMIGAASNRPVDADWPGGVLDYGQVETYLAKGDQSGTADAKAKTVTYAGKEVTIDLVAVQPGHEDQTFEAHGLTNPTLVVPRGALVHFELVNMDYGNDMEHGIILTQAPPPYASMSMMDVGGGVARLMPLLPWGSAEAVQRARYAAFGNNVRRTGAGNLLVCLSNTGTCGAGHVWEVRGAMTAVSSRSRHRGLIQAAGE